MAKEADRLNRVSELLELWLTRRIWLQVESTR